MLVIVCRFESCPGHNDRPAEFQRACLLFSHEEATLRGRGCAATGSCTEYKSVGLYAANRANSPGPPSFRRLRFLPDRPPARKCFLTLLYSHSISHYTPTTYLFRTIGFDRTVSLTGLNPIVFLHIRKESAYFCGRKNEDITHKSQHSICMRDHRGIS